MSARNISNTRFLQGSTFNLQMFLGTNSHSLFQLGAYIGIALYIPPGLVSKGAVPVFLVGMGIVRSDGYANLPSYFFILILP